MNDTRRSVGKRTGAWIAVAVAISGAAISIVRYEADRRTRRGVEEFAGMARLAPASPDLREALQEPSWDLALDAVVTSVRDDNGGRVPSDVEPRARELLLRAVASRPGWAPHRYLLATVSGQGSDDRARRVLRLAADGAPGMDAVWPDLARADLDAWDRLPPAERSVAGDTFRRALQRLSFVQTDFARVAGVIGVPRAASLLSERASLFDAAAVSMSVVGETRAASEMISRAEQLERRERREDLDDLDRMRNLGDRDALRTACWTWYNRHPFGQFDEPRDREDLAHLLEIWPDDRRSAWSRKVRIRLVEFFLDGERPEASPELLDRTLESLADPPPLLRARVALRAGKGDEAERLARAGSEGGEDRTSYLLDLARWQVANGRFEEARITLGGLPPAVRGGCDATLIGKQAARGSGDRAGAAEPESVLGGLRAVPSDDWAPGGSLPLCLDPARSEALALNIGPGAPAILAYGWGGSRTATVALSGDATVLHVPAVRRGGQNVFWAQFLSGGAGRSLQATLEESS